MAVQSMKTIDIGKDFSPVPSGRYRSKGRFTGEVFREDFLVPALRNFDVVSVNLDHTEGFGSSFLDEAFGGLVTAGIIQKSELLQRLNLVGESPAGARYRSKVLEYINSAQPGKSTK